jgi:hypothetical protein
MGRDELREARELALVEERLVRRYADRIGPAEVRRELRTAFHRFDDRPVRTYVMILTERVAGERLAQRASTAPARRGPVARAGA